MEAVAGQFVSSHVIPKLPGPSALQKQVPDEPLQLFPCSGHVLTPMQQRGYRRCVMLVRNERVGLENRLEPLACTTRLISDRGELLDVAVNLTTMPGDEDPLDVGEVLVKRRPTNPSLFGDPGHGHRRQPVRCDNFCRRADDGVGDGAPVPLNRLVP